MSQAGGERPGADRGSSARAQVEGAEELPDLFDEQRCARSGWARLGLLAAALGLFALGVLGWLVPVVTGIPFYVLGLFCLAMTSARLTRRMNAYERRLPLRYRRALRPRRLRAWLDRRRARRAAAHRRG